MPLDYADLLRQAEQADDLPESKRRIVEQRARRVAKRQGLELTRSRRRDPHALDYGGYMLIDPDTNAIVVGTMAGRPYGMTLAQAVEWLLDLERKRPRAPGSQGETTAA
jgi:hypothetical protein